MESFRVVVFVVDLFFCDGAPEVLGSNSTDVIGVEGTQTTNQ